MTTKRAGIKKASKYANKTEKKTPRQKRGRSYRTVDKDLNSRPIADMGETERRAIRRASDRFGALDPATGKPRLGSTVTPVVTKRAKLSRTPEQNAARAASRALLGEWLHTPGAKAEKTLARLLPALALMSDEEVV